MPVLIQPRYLKLSELFERRLFRIPQYQRAYSWQKQQRQDLFDDIRTVHEKGVDFHFMATIVGLQRESKEILTDEYSVIDVVDGQQRLTTLILLYRAISKRLNRDDSGEGRLADEMDGLLVKTDELSLLLLQTNHDYKDFYTEYVREGTIPLLKDAETLAERAIVEAIHDCEKFVSQWDSVLPLATILKNRLTFIFHEISDESAVYTVFEVLNSRGLAVAWLDRLKSLLMAVAFESATGNEQEYIDELHSIWRKVYEVIGLRQGLGAEALRFAATLRARNERSKLFGEEAAVQEMRALVGDDPAASIRMSRWVLSVAEAVDRVLSKRRLAAVTKISHARIAAVAIELACEEEDKGPALEQWERSTFRIFGLSRRDARTKVGDYVRLSHQICSERPPDDIEARLRGLAEGEFEIESALTHVRDADCYNGWEEELRYFFSRYEEHLCRVAQQDIASETWEAIWSDSPSRSIEHIQPQSKGSDERTDEGIFVHRLGNLTMLPPGVNSGLRDDDPAQKADCYGEQALRVTRNLQKTAQEWTREAVSEREDRLIEWAKSEWSDP